MINRALADLAPLIGQWRMELYAAAFLPDTDSRVTGSFTVDWIEGGAAIAMHQGDGDGPPMATWIIGRDESEATYLVLYADDRGVSRLYNMSFVCPNWQIWRTTPEFSQRFEAVLAEDGQSVKGAWKKSVDGGKSWELDFNVDYIRVPARGSR